MSSQPPTPREIAAKKEAEAFLSLQNHAVIILSNASSPHIKSFCCMTLISKYNLNPSTSVKKLFKYTMQLDGVKKVIDSLTKRLQDRQIDHTIIEQNLNYMLQLEIITK